jgi:hypothetical protein
MDESVNGNNSRVRLAAYRASTYDRYSNVCARPVMGSFTRIGLAIGAATLLCSASAADLVTLTTRGTIAQGTDYSGVFTTPGSSLANLPFSLTVVADTSYLTDRYLDGGGHIAEPDGIGVSLGFSGDLAIDGHHYEWRIDSGYGSVSLYSSAGGAAVGISAYGAPALSVQVFLGSAHPATGLRDNTDFHQVIELTDAAPSDSYTVSFGLGGTMQANQEGFNLVANPTYAYWAPSPVPEPSRMAMWLAGAGALAWARHLRCKRCSTESAGIKVLFKSRNP